jgi:hypothetical protein
MMRLTPGSSTNSILKPGEVALRLLTRWRFKTRFETRRPGRSQFAHAIAYDAVAASEAAFLELTRQPHGCAGGIGSQSFAQIGFEVIDDAWPRCPLFVNRRLQPFGDFGPDCLSIDTKLPGEGADRQTLAMQIQDHDKFPKFDHRALPPACRRGVSDSAATKTE